MNSEVSQQPRDRVEDPYLIEPTQRKSRTRFDSNMEETTRQRSQAETIHLMTLLPANHNRSHNEGISEKAVSGEDQEIDTDDFQSRDARLSL
jgi:hypothetical protein